MKTYAYFTLLILSATITFAQTPKIDHTVREEMARQKEKFYRQFILNEQQITANQDDYDIKYYALDLTPDPIAKFLSGVVQVVGEVIAPSLDHVELNFLNGMSITDVHVFNFPNVQLNYHRNDDILSINLDRTYVQGEKFSLVIAYNGRPQSSFYFDTYGQNPMIFTLSEPFGARAWWPCKDVPSDKADSVDIRVTVPSNLIVASNGTLRETITAGAKTTYWWHEQYPIVTYLVSLAIHPYKVYYDDYLYNNNADTMKIHFYTFPGFYDKYYSSNTKVKDMIACFANLFGEYPFIKEKYGHADCTPANWGAMEHQTCTSYSIWNEWVFVHELAHQWWGDMITCDNFHHIWLNEGFATYCEALWFEYAYPPTKASEYQMDNNLYLGPGTVFVEDPQSQPIFDNGLSYDKGSWVLHMLRHVVGDSVFFDILKTYYASPEHQYGTATTAEFQAMCEQISGINLDKFFHQWIYEEYYPYYSYGWNLKPEINGYSVKIRIDQIQTKKIQKNLSLFWMPIDVKVTMESSDTMFVVRDSLQSQNFELLIDEEPLSIEIDPDNWILKKVQKNTILPYPYAEDIRLNNTYQIPESGILSILSKVANPNNENLQLTAIIQGTDESISDSCLLYDDGNHADSLAGDGIFGGFWPVKEGERNYTVKAKTLSLNTNYYNISLAESKFTTIGPLNFYDLVFKNPPQKGAYNSAYLILKNNGKITVAENIAVAISTNDSLIFVPPVTVPMKPIAPGDTSRSTGSFRIFIAADHPGTEFPIKVDIYQHGYLYWTDDSQVTTYVNPSEIVLIDAYSLLQNYPNPFNPSTTIEFALPKSAFVTIKVYNLLGEEVITLIAEKREAGIHRLSWDARGLASGLYLYRLEADSFIQTRKFMLLR